MEPFHEVARTVALTMGVAWASGINLYAAILVLGLLGSTGNMALPENLMLLSEPLVLWAAGLMYAVEFFADKIPGLDSGWDGLHTFIRIPAGALLAAGAVGEVNPSLVLTAAIVGGGLATATHATKAGTRLVINTSPEPASNWAASLGEDLAVIGGLLLALHHPLVFLGLLILFVLLMIWLIPRLWTAVREVFGFLGRLLGGTASRASFPVDGKRLLQDKKPERSLPEK